MEKELTKREIPKSIVVILLVLTVIISILGTWTILDALEKAKTIPTEPSYGAANVRLNINKPLENPVSLGQGKVSIKILEAE